MMDEVARLVINLMYICGFDSHPGATFECTNIFVGRETFFVLANLIAKSVWPGGKFMFNIGCGNLFKTRDIIHSLNTRKFNCSWQNQFDKSIWPRGKRGRESGCLYYLCIYQSCSPITQGL